MSLALTEITGKLLRIYAFSNLPESEKGLGSKVLGRDVRPQTPNPKPGLRIQGLLFSCGREGGVEGGVLGPGNGGDSCTL